MGRPAYRRGVYSQDLISGGRGVERVEGESVGRYMTSPENLIFSMKMLYFSVFLYHQSINQSTRTLIQVDKPQRDRVNEYNVRNNDNLDINMHTDGKIIP